MTPAQFRAGLKALGWSQARAARELGACNHQRVSEWCRGARAIPRAYALSLDAHVKLAACQARDQARELAGSQVQDLPGVPFGERWGLTARALPAVETQAQA